jgi:hypothetical protein
MSLRIAAIEGDRIDKEVVPEGVPAVETPAHAARRADG